MRPIDDYSQSQVNSTVTIHEKPTVDNPDAICAIFNYLMRALRDQGKEFSLQARSLDLTSAYRQLCVPKESAQYSYLSVYGPTQDGAALFRQVALPFGSRTAVNAFIRCARFLQWAAAKCLVLPMSCYFDDFIIASTPGLVDNSQRAVSLLFDILGWAFDKSGVKSDRFSNSVAALGVLFNLGSTGMGRILVENTSKRISEVVELINSVLRTLRLSHKEALVLRGRLAFCDAFIFGRSGRLALQMISQHAYHKPFTMSVQTELQQSLKLLRRRLESGPPRLVSMEISQVFYIFTDAAFADECSGGLGGVLLDPSGSILQWFSVQLSSDFVISLMKAEQDVAIGELESLAVLIGLRLWDSRLASSKLLLFIDNEGARFSLIKGYCKSLRISQISALITSLLDGAFIIPWFGRVPSSSNIADFPSRNTSHLLLVECARVSHAALEMLIKECHSQILSFDFDHL